MAIARQTEKLQIVPRQGLDQTVGSTNGSTLEKPTSVCQIDPATEKQWEKLGQLAFRVGTVASTGILLPILFH
jgi:hypothetical protein